MTICCISDTHNQHNVLDLSDYPADVLVHAGDFTNSGKDVEIINFLEWFNDQPYEYKVLIAGNHDLSLESNPEWFAHLLNRYPNIIYLKDTYTTIHGKKFYGSPYSNEFFNWAFMEEEPQLQKIWSKIPDDTNVLITHGPAYGIHDLVLRPSGRDPHVGSKTLLERRKQLPNLQAHITGHIHEAYGASTTDDIQNACPCIVDFHYKPINEPIILEI